MDIALANARNAFLDLVGADATEFECEPDGDIDSNGHMTDCSKITIRAPARVFSEFVEAMGIVVKPTQTAFDAVCEALGIEAGGMER